MREGGTQVRAGAVALSLLSAPLHVQVLRAVEEGSRSLADLRRAAGSPPETTLRSHLRALCDLGVLERRQQSNFPGSVDYDLARAGRELLSVVEILESWLTACPQESLELGTPAARSVIRALVAGWDSGVVRALAARPLALTELSRLITGLSYPSLERRLGSMRLAGQIEPCRNGGRGTPYQVTPWLSQAAAPLLAAARWERRCAPKVTSPIARIDVESAFLLTVPRVNLPSIHKGLCRLTVESRNGNGERRLAGVLAAVEDGRVAGCASRLTAKGDAWASGSAAEWLRAVVDGEPALDAGGDAQLAEALVEALHRGYVSVLRPRAAVSR